jgi:hypothetical protein
MGNPHRAARLLALAMFGTLVVLPACSSSSAASGPSSEPANPCATKGASYLETLVEQAGGTCGPITSQVVNINSDGTITTSTPLSCAHVSQTGCVAQDTDCTFSSMGFDFSETFDVTFTSDGSSASGLITLSGSGNGQNCASTYDVTFARQ